MEHLYYFMSDAIPPPPSSPVSCRTGTVPPSRSTELHHATSSFLGDHLREGRGQIFLDSPSELCRQPSSLSSSQRPTLDSASGKPGVSPEYPNRMEATGRGGGGRPGSGTLPFFFPFVCCNSSASWLGGKTTGSTSASPASVDVMGLSNTDGPVPPHPYALPWKSATDSDEEGKKSMGTSVEGATMAPLHGNVSPTVTQPPRSRRATPPSAGSSISMSSLSSPRLLRQHGAHRDRHRRPSVLWDKETGAVATVRSSPACTRPCRHFVTRIPSRDCNSDPCIRLDCSLASSPTASPATEQTVQGRMTPSAMVPVPPVGAPASARYFRISRRHQHHLGGSLPRPGHTKLPLSPVALSPTSDEHGSRSTTLRHDGAIAVAHVHHDDVRSSTEATALAVRGVISTASRPFPTAPRGEDDSDARQRLEFQSPPPPLDASAFYFVTPLPSQGPPPSATPLSCLSGAPRRLSVLTKNSLVAHERGGGAPPHFNVAAVSPVAPPRAVMRLAVALRRSGGHGLLTVEPVQPPATLARQFREEETSGAVAATVLVETAQRLNRARSRRSLPTMDSCDAHGAAGGDRESARGLPGDMKDGRGGVGEGIPTSASSFSPVLDSVPSNKPVTSTAVLPVTHDAGSLPSPPQAIATGSGGGGAAGGAALNSTPLKTAASVTGTAASDSRDSMRSPIHLSGLSEPGAAANYSLSYAKPFRGSLLTLHPQASFAWVLCSGERIADAAASLSLADVLSSLQRGTPSFTAAVEKGETPRLADTPSPAADQLQQGLPKDQQRHRHQRHCAQEHLLPCVSIAAAASSLPPPPPPPRPFSSSSIRRGGGGSAAAGSPIERALSRMECAGQRSPAADEDTSFYRQSLLDVASQMATSPPLFE